MGDLLFEPIAERFEVCEPVGVGEECLGQFSGYAQADDGGGVFGAAAAVAFLRPAQVLGVQPDAGADEQRPGAFGTVELVG